MVLLACGMALVAAGLAAPSLDGSRYSERIRQSLELTLGRKVEFEQVHFTLFSGPGFALDRVTISEDPRYGIEPFAFVPELQARIRLDKLLLGQIQFSSLRLLEPSLNLVKRDDGTWNVVELVQRLGAPRRMPLNFFPVFEVSRGRVDFKLGARKTALYLLDSDLQIFPERSSKFFMRFSGSPARTDRAGNGFGHLHGTVNLYSNRTSTTGNQLEADLSLEPSNLSELATLIEGHDVGIHGDISSHAIVEGPFSALRVRGALTLGNVHRWDLLPGSGNESNLKYEGVADLVANRLSLQTVTGEGESSPVSFQMLVTSAMVNPRISLLAHLDKVPIGKTLPLARRMGISVPDRLKISGTLDGDLNLMSQSGLSGFLVLEDVEAALPQVPGLHSPRLEAVISEDRMLVHPATFQTASGPLQIGGEFRLFKSVSQTSISVQDYPVSDLKRQLASWLGAPAFLESLAEGQVTGSFAYSCNPGQTPLWSGRYQFSSTVMSLPGWSTLLEQAEGRVVFNGSNLELSRFSASAGRRTIKATYRYSEAANRSARLRVEMPVADVRELEAWLAPTLQAQGWLARLGVSKREIPAWLADRDLDVELSVRQFLSGDTNLGTLATQLRWQGTDVRFLSIDMRMPAGQLQAHGTASLSNSLPHYVFATAIHGVPWRSGIISADANLETSGVGISAWKNLNASGSFSGMNVHVTAEDAFAVVSGIFRCTGSHGWPNLQLSKLQAVDAADTDWSGDGEVRSDGRLVLDLQHAGQPRRVISTLLPENADADPLVAKH